MSISRPFSMSMQKKENSHLIDVVIEGESSNFNNFEEFYRGMCSEFAWENFAGPFTFEKDGIVVRFHKMQNSPIKVQQRFCRVMVTFAEEARSIVLDTLSRMAYIHFEKMLVTVDCEDEATLVILWRNMYQHQIEIKAKTALQQKLFAELIELLNSINPVTGLSWTPKDQDFQNPYAPEWSPKL